MKEVKSAVLKDLMKSMGARSLKDLKGKKVKLEDEVEISDDKPEVTAEPYKPKPLHLSVDGETAKDLKSKLDAIFG